MVESPLSKGVVGLNLDDLTNQDCQQEREKYLLKENSLLARYNVIVALQSSV